MVRWLLAALHLLALGIGLGAIWARAQALRRPLDSSGLHRVLVADTWWGVAALLWIATGVGRLFGALEKPTAYYLSNHLFWSKMAFLGLILALEVGPMVAFIRWRVALARGTQPDTRRAGRYAGISFLQTALVILMVLIATAMARGFGSPRGT